MGIEYIDKTHAKLVVTRGSGKNRERKVKRITYTSKKDAKRQYDVFVLSVDFGVDSKTSVEKLLDWYIDLFESNGGKDTTVIGYKTAKKRITERIGSKKCSKVTLQDIDRYVKKQSDKYSAKTIRNDISLLSAAYKEGIRHGFLNKNPCEYAKSPKRSKPDIEVLSDYDIAVFMHQLDSAPLDFKVACELALFCGMRRSEVLGLNKGDVTDTVTINKVRHRIDKQDIITTPKTTSSVRTLAVPSFVQDDVQRLIQEQASRPDQNGLLILNLFGEIVNPNWITSQMKRVLADTNLPQITFHGLRHTYASMLIAQGIPISEISAQLGHASIDITLRTYAHLFRQATTASKHIATLLGEQYGTKMAPVDKEKACDR